MEKVAYLKCTCKSEDKILARQLQLQGYDVRIIKGNPKHSKEARKYNQPLPFIINGGAIFDARSGEPR